MVRSGCACDSDSRVPTRKLSHHTARHDGAVNGQPAPLRVVHAAAPIRICDNGGWTDTWFAGHGNVFNIGVSPYVEARIAVHPVGVLPDRIVLEAENFGDRYAFAPGALPGRHPLLEAAVDDVGLPAGASIEIKIGSAAPAGSSTLIP